MARIRETFNGKDAVAHAWSRQDQERGREADKLGGRIFFEGPTIYSYGQHFPIATFHQKKGKEKIVLFTTREYSPTTSAHKFAARGAVSHFEIIYCKNPLEAAHENHAGNMADFEANAKTIALKLAKSTKPEKYISQIDAERRRMEAYAGYFKIGIKKYKFKFLYLESKEMATATTKKEIAAAKKAAEALRVKREAYEAEQAEARAKREAKAAADFHSGEVDTVRDSEWTYLRFQAGEIQTSKGIRLEFENAKEYYSRLKSLQAKADNLGGMLSRGNGGFERIEFEGYDLRAVTSEYFEIGCHKIKFAEADALAKLAGFTMEAMLK